jgi:hypothetical protein
MQKVALTHNSVKNNECDVTYAVITELCISRVLD